MGRKSTSIRYRNRKKKRTAAPDLPEVLKAALEERGVVVPEKGKAREFYNKLGIQSDPNADAKKMIGYHDRLAEVRAQTKPPEPEVEIGDAEVFQEAADSIPKDGLYQKHLTDNEIKIISNMRAFYGDDYESMLVDHRRNPMQWSISQIKEKFSIYEKLSQTLQEAFESTQIQ